MESDIPAPALRNSLPVSTYDEAILTTDDVPPIVLDVIRFVDCNFEKIQSFDNDLTSGWEGWLQAELAYMLRDNQCRALPLEYTLIEREIPTYQNKKQRIDLFCRTNRECFDEENKCISPHDGPAAHPRLGVELKAGTGYEDYETGTVYSYRKEFIKDIEKTQSMDTSWTSACGARIFAIWVTLAPEVKGYERVSTQGYGSVRYKETASGAYVFWWHKDFARA